MPGLNHHQRPAIAVLTTRFVYCSRKPRKTADITKLDCINGKTLLVLVKQESPAIADKNARHESMPKIAPIRRAYNVVADNTGLSSFV